MLVNTIDKMAKLNVKKLKHNLLLRLGVKKKMFQAPPFFSFTIPTKYEIKYK